ncbi:hypothetical protein [Streptomyces sp. S.PNR 29]|uniref:hypothetical protein n=1 Tax=Streptomyces sp. S.PNR 29 TaxID=2973805 RepID=UPI0025B0288C|nr:hypothetical protein [Streptomyces sp. S.PNR 29]MDN0194443.1 hypothetical protein [Streptomyces sp. S.PNR 29]
MRMKSRKAAVVASALAMTLSGLVAGGTTAGAATQSDVGIQACYDTARSYYKPEGSYYYPSGYPGGTWLTATSNCNDINIRTNSNRWVRVCFDPTSGSPYCQDEYTYAESGQWAVIATAVLNGTKFKFQFWSGPVATGSWAA